MALLTGDSGSFTFAGQSLTVADFGAWEMNVERPVHEYTPFGYLLTKLAVGQIRGTGTLEAACESGSTTPPIPSGANGSIVLYTKTINTPTASKSFTGNAILHALGIGVASRGGAPVSVYRYAFSFSATASTDTITPA